MLVKKMEKKLIHLVVQALSGNFFPLGFCRGFSNERSFLKSAFTMIELIFAIVILGILAAVAIPKLTVARNDAIAAVKAQDLATAVQDFASFYSSRGYLSTPDEMTNVSFGSDANINLGAANVKVNFLECIEIRTSSTYGSQSDTIIVSYIAAKGDIDNCYQVALAASDITGAIDKNSDSNRSFNIGGNRVVY